MESMALNYKKVNPKIVAAITAALYAAGLLAPGDKITAIKSLRKQNLWKRSGLIKLMQDRDFTLHEI